MRTYISIAVAVGLWASIGCRGRTEAPPEQPPPAAEPTTEPEPARVPEAQETAALTAEQKIEKARECFDKFNARGDWPACYAARATFEFVDGVPVTRGPAPDVVGNYLAAFPDLEGRSLVMLASGDKLVSLDVLTGTNAGPLMGAAATGKKIGLLAGHAWDTDAQGIWTRATAYVDQATMAGQLGTHKRPHRPVLEKPTATGVTAVTTDSASEGANAAAVRSYYEAFNAHDLGKMSALFAEDAVMTDVTMPADVTGPKGHDEILGMYFKAFPDARVETEWTFAAGDYVASALRYTGTNSGPAQKLGLKKPSDKKVTVRSLDVWKLEGGKAKRRWGFYNGFSLGVQLGAIELPAPATTPAPTPTATPPAEAPPAEAPR
jgi:steroid delta-isomerase-like uncharacterized protein